MMRRKIPWQVPKPAVSWKGKFFFFKQLDFCCVRGSPKWTLGKGFSLEQTPPGSGHGTKPVTVQEMSRQCTFSCGLVSSSPAMTTWWSSWVPSNLRYSKIL